MGLGDFFLRQQCYIFRWKYISPKTQGINVRLRLLLLQVMWCNHTLMYSPIYDIGRRLGFNHIMIIQKLHHAFMLNTIGR